VFCLAASFCTSASNRLIEISTGELTASGLSHHYNISHEIYIQRVLQTHGWESPGPRALTYGKNQFVGRVGGVVLAEDICSIPGLGHDYLEVVLQRGIGGTFSITI
jgi:hypothetical protein